MTDQEYISTAIKMGFDEAAIIDVAQIEFDPSFRKYCEANTCGNYGANYTCPPVCGSPEFMQERVRHFSKGLVLKTTYVVHDVMDNDKMTPLKKENTEKALELVKLLQKKDPREFLNVNAVPCFYCTPCNLAKGLPCAHPERRFPCLSAYCIDVTKLAQSCGMNLGWGEHEASFLSIYLYN